MENILLIGMDFYNYEEAMIRLLKQKYRVCHFVDKKDFTIDHFHVPVDNKRKQRMIESYQNHFLKKTEGIKFRYVLVLVGRYLTAAFLGELKRRNPTAVFVLYLWDDVKRVENFAYVRGFYDRIISFDPVDASNYGFDFVPLMYIKKIKRQADAAVDVCSVMNLHTDREKVAAMLLKDNDSLKFSICFKSPLFFTVKKRLERFLDKDSSHNLHYRKTALKYDSLIKRMLDSKAILDIQFPSQIGLTMRTFDVMSVGRKLITTNESIKYYDFYNPNNIAIIDREDPVIPKGFLDTPYEPIPDEVLDKYSLENWLSVIFEGKREKYLIKGNPYGL